MKLAELKSLGHNVADSLASGIGLLIGVYTMDIFAEASSSAEGFIVVDFLNGTSTGGKTSAELERAITMYRDVLPTLSAKHDLEMVSIKELSARFGVDAVYGRHFTVTVESVDGKRSTDRYVGVPGRRLRTRR